MSDEMTSRFEVNEETTLICSNRIRRFIITKLIMKLQEVFIHCGFKLRDVLVDIM